MSSGVLLFGSEPRQPIAESGCPALVRPRPRKLPSGADPGLEHLRAAYLANYGRAVRLARMLTGSREAAEDIVQEAFVRLAPKLDSIPGEATSAYVTTTVLNLARNRARGIERWTAKRSMLADPVATRDLDLRDLDLWQAVLSLSTRQRECIVLRYYEDLDERATAELLGCAPGSVKRHLSRALDRLREELRDVD